MKRFNPIPVVADHLLGERHCNLHRMSAGIIVMVAGSAIAHSGVYFHGEFITEIFGWFIHGVGGMPWMRTIFGKVS